MKKLWFLSLFASIPLIAALLAIQSCGGVGGPTDGGGGGGGGVSAAFLALLTNEQRAASYIGPEACGNVACHGGASIKGGKTTEDPIYTHWKDTKHFEKGVTCESCHGPGSAHRDAPTTAGLILTFPKVVEPVVCAQCHGPIADQYNFSKHSKLIQDPIEQAIANPGTYGRSSRCIACHSGLVRAEIIEEDRRDLGTLTDAEIREVSENTLNDVQHTADCVTCHNPHKKTGNLTQNSEEVQLRHQVFNTDVTNIGPSKPAASFTTYDHICAQCHNGRGTDPADAKLRSGTSRPSMHDSNQMQMLMGFGGVEGTGPVESNTAHAQAPGQCTKCHMPNSRHTFTVSFDTSCTPCHTAADAAVRANTIKSDILNLLISLRTRMENWARTAYPGQTGNSFFWDYTSNITAEGYTSPNQTTYPIQILRARHNYYFVVRSGDYGVHNAPYAKYLLRVANDNLTAISVPLAAQSPMSQAQKLQVIESDKARARQSELTAPN